MHGGRPRLGRVPDTETPAQRTAGVGSHAPLTSGPPKRSAEDNAAVADGFHDESNAAAVIGRRVEVLADLHQV